jgi:hypothetical protein
MRTIETIFSILVALACLAMTAAVLMAYPLSPWPLIVVLTGYAAVLWLRPEAWLIAVPVALAGIDLSPWTGWTLIGESDLFVLVTLAVLALRTPLRLGEIFPHGPARVVIVISTATCLIAALIGYRQVVSSAASSLVYLQPVNAFRVAKGFFVALLLLPFLRERHTAHDDAMKLFNLGMLTALTVVAVETLLEREIFPGAFDVTSLYPAAGPFASMHLGAVDLGAFVAMALPFALLRRSARHRMERNGLRLLGLAALYVSVATFSIIVYLLAIIAIAVTITGRRTPKERGGAIRKVKKGVFFYLNRFLRYGVLAVAAFAAIIGSSFIGAGADILGDKIMGREHMLSRRLDLRTHTIRTALFGMGLGTFPRVAAVRAPESPSNFKVSSDANGNFLSLTSSPTFFLGQKVPVEPGKVYTLSLSLRAPAPNGALRVILCDKYILFSENCRGVDFRVQKTGAWEVQSKDLPTAGLDPDPLFGLLHRPIDLALNNMNNRTIIDVKDIRLTAPDGAQVIVNGDFTRGADRWFVADENHDAWQIMNQFVLTVFESGLFGLIALLTTVGAALIGARRLMRRGDRMATAVVASLTVFLFLCLFQPPLQSPRLATIFYLICFVGLLMLEQGTYRGYLAQPRRPWASRKQTATVTPISSGRSGEGALET